ncbi:PAS domain S-box protein [Brasilonema sp. UFV-L1]|uniref:PAS domain S-box protein n=1 Tax=Brasilonema sp. UFV-L1 TaxID=2234130 RepID=UPI00145ED5E2|nr:PAS domain S-box protein [Brasilonema sp. UFV-L1]NMG08080.1 hypothetical protein [Brasilonema sp. UFV-L1]
MSTFAQFLSLPLLDSAIDFFPLTVAPDTLLSDVIAVMRKCQPQARCVLIVENRQIVGCFTEHNALRLLLCDINLHTAKVSDVMTTSVLTLKRSDVSNVVFILSFLRQHHLFCVPLVDEQGQVVGLCTYESICQSLEQQAQGTLSSSSDCPESDKGLAETATQALPESEEPFSKLANELPILIWMRDANNLNTFLNQSCVEFTGRPLEELLGEGCVEGIHPEDKQRYFDTYEAAFKNHQRFQYICRYLCPDQEYHSLLNMGVPRFGSDGSFIGYIGCSIDITERMQTEATLQQVQAELEMRVEERTRAVKEMNKQLIFEMTDRLYVEEQLRQSQEMLQFIMDNIPQSIFWKDTASAYLGCNRIFAEMVGLESPEDIVGKTDYDLLVNEQEADLYYESDLRVMLTDTPEYDVIFRHIRKDGKQAWLEASKIPLHDHQGNVIGVLGTFEDITERKQAEESLQLRDRAIAASSNGIIIADVTMPDSPIIYANPALEEITGYSIQEVIGKNYSFLHGCDIDQPGMAELQDAIAQGKSCTVVLRNYRKDGTLFWSEVSISPVYDNCGKFTHYISIQTDITQRKQLEEELKAALHKEKELNELKSRFVSMTSHEFRTPLSTILSSSELLEHYRHRWTEEKQVSHLHRIQTAVKRMTEMLNNILVIGKVEAGKLDFIPVPLDLVEYCHYLVEELQLNINHQYAIHFSSQFDSMPSCMDEKLLGHILSNLLSNGIKYSPTGSTVRFTLTFHDELAVFTIQDQGIGIPPEDLPHLFESFHRGTNVANIQGTGLGLAIVKNCVETHHGEITVKSEIGVGTIFTVTLPLNYHA